VQSVTACANVTLPTVAPKIAETLGVDASWIGYQVSLLFGCAVLSATFGGGLVSRLGPARTGQVAALLSMSGMALAAAPLLATMLVSTVLCGLALGLVNPGAAQVIVRFTPARHRNGTRPAWSESGRNPPPHRPSSPSPHRYRQCWQASRFPQADAPKARWWERATDPLSMR
jgi:MFS family permease